MPRNNPACFLAKKSASTAESGNVFLFILIGIVLFAAITYVMSSGLRSEGTSKLSARQADLTASLIIDYAQKLTRGIDKIRRNGCSESDIRFAGNASWGVDATTVPEKCKVGSIEGANISRFEGDPEWYIGSPAGTYSGSMRAEGVGENVADLIFWIFRLKPEICMAINNKLGIPNPDGMPPRDTTSNAYDGVGFGGNFGGASNTIDAPELIGKHIGCFVSNRAAGGGIDDQYYFYAVILAR